MTENTAPQAHTFTVPAAPEGALGPVQRYTPFTHERRNLNGDLISVLDRGDGTGVVHDHEHGVTRYDGLIMDAHMVAELIAKRRRDDIHYS